MIEVVSFSKKYPHAKDFAVENVNMKIAILENTNNGVNTIDLAKNNI